MSHKFKIEMTLSNKDYCNGCDCLISTYLTGECSRYQKRLEPNYEKHLKGLIARHRLKVCIESDDK